MPIAYRTKATPLSLLEAHNAITLPISKSGPVWKGIVQPSQLTMLIAPGTPSSRTRTESPNELMRKVKPKAQEVPLLPSFAA